jgi:hypothetical protein
MLSFQYMHRMMAIMGLCALLMSGCGTDKNVGSSDKIVFPTAKFALDAGADTTIFGAQGTRIFIEKETFQFADGTPVTGPIELSLQEFYDKSDIVLADLSTESDGKLLETGGMLNIAATSEGKEVEIKADKRIVVHFPKTKGFMSEPMDLFYADAAGTDSTVQNWTVDTTDLVKRTLKIGSWGWWYPEWDDSTIYNFVPKGYESKDYYVNGLDLYLNAYNFSEAAQKEIESNPKPSNYFEEWNYGIECEMHISKEGYVKDPKVNSKVSAATRKEVLTFLRNIPQLEPGKNKKGEIIERRGLLLIQGGEIVPLYKTREEYLGSFDQKYAKFEKSPIKNMDDAEMEYYIFSVAKLGWINCDRFWNANDPVDFIVQAPVDKDTKVKLVFKDIAGVLMADIVDGKYVFPKVPRGTEATIMATRNMDGNFEAAIQKVTISDQPLQKLEFEEMTMAALKQELEKLN